MDKSSIIALLTGLLLLIVAGAVFVITGPKAAAVDAAAASAKGMNFSAMLFPVIPLHDRDNCVVHRDVCRVTVPVDSTRRWRNRSRAYGRNDCRSSLRDSRRMGPADRVEQGDYYYGSGCCFCHSDCSRIDCRHAKKSHAGRAGSHYSRCRHWRTLLGYDLQQCARSSAPSKSEH